MGWTGYLGVAGALRFGPIIYQPELGASQKEVDIEVVDAPHCLYVE